MKQNRKYLILLFLLLIAGGFVLIDNRLSRGVRPVDLNKLPLAIGGWSGKTFPVSERILKILETEYILDRDYVNEQGRHIYLSIVYYPDNKIGFHNPESCNTGEGAKIAKKDVLPIGKNESALKVNRLIMERTQGNKVILYFFVSGDYITHDYFKFRLHMMKQQMGFRRPSGAQVQIHAVIGQDLQTTISIMEDFIRNLAPHLPKYLS